MERIVARLRHVFSGKTPRVFSYRLVKVIKAQLEFTHMLYEGFWGVEMCFMFHPYTYDLTVSLGDSGIQS